MITARGKELLATTPATINNKVLKQYPEFVEFLNPKRENDAIELIAAGVEEQTPDEIIDAGYRLIRQSLAQELLEKVQKATPRFF